MISSIIASELLPTSESIQNLSRVDIPDLTVETGLKMVLVAVACAAISIIFCMTLQGISKLYMKYFKNPYIRIAAASAIIIAITLLLRTTDYMGAGNNLIELAIEEGQTRPLDFFWKILLTALTMRAGFRGGEIGSVVLHRRNFRMSHGASDRTFPVYLRGRRNGSTFLRCYQLSDHLDPDRI